jgi:type I restriction enzyme S subunit
MNMAQPTPLSSVADVIRGVTFSKKDVQSSPGDGLAPVLRAGNIQGQLRLNDDLVFVSKQKISAKQKLRAGDIVMCTSSGSSDVVGKSAFLEQDWDGSFGAFCAAIRARSDWCEPRYLYHYLQTPDFRLWTSNSSGINIKNIRKSELDGVLIPLPRIEEQRRIAAILDKADAIRRKRANTACLADDLATSAFIHMVGYLNSDYGDWVPMHIEQLAENRKGSMRTGPFGSALLHGEFVDEGVAVLGIDNAVRNSFAWDERRFITVEKYAELKRYRVFPGDVIITIMGTTGRSAVVPDDIPEAITTKHLATITCDRRKVLPEFLSFAIHSDPQIIRQIKRANKGAIMDGLNLSIIKQLEINVPPICTQEAFVRALRMTTRLKDESSSIIGSGESLFTSLSQRAYRGEL